MKGPSRRRGNSGTRPALPTAPRSLNEGPLQKEGQFGAGGRVVQLARRRLNEGPLQKEGQSAFQVGLDRGGCASMKGPSRRRGNAHPGAVGGDSRNGPQ